MNAAAARQPVKFFTVEKANQTLPLVRMIVSDIVRLYQDVKDRRERLERIRHPRARAERTADNPYDEEVRQVEEELERDVARLEGFVEELGKIGVELKDPAIGLIDFHTLVDGRDAYLCWKLGEDDIAFWHELDAGFQGRQSLLQGISKVEGPASDQGAGPKP